LRQNRRSTLGSPVGSKRVLSSESGVL